MKSKFLSLILLIVFFISGCTKISNAVTNTGNDNPHIEFITPLSIGRLSPISISFMDTPKCPMGDALELYPKTKGVWEYTENKATFIPDEPYKASSKMTIKADLGKLFEDGSSIYEKNFYVEEASYSVNMDEIRLNENTDSFTVSGNVTTDIPYSEKEVSEILNAKIKNKAQQISWKKSDVPEKWNFSISIDNQTEKAQDLILKWSGKAIGISKANKKILDGKKVISIPAKAAFSIIDINTSKNNVILVSFSKALDSAQDIASFIKTLDFGGKKKTDFSTSIHGNTLSLFSDSNWSDIQTVSFEPGIKSSDGIYLAQASSVSLSNNWELPSVRFMNSNVILPTTQGTVLPIETRNLAGVIVQVYQIYERNINQFLQDNELDKSRNLYRVGEPVWEKKINFAWNDSMQNKYIPRGLELSELVKRYPQGMYHIRVSFRQDQIKYHNTAFESYPDLPMPSDSIEPYSVPVENSSWDYYESMNYEQRNSYWRNKNNPFHPAFYLPSYNSDNTISRNVLVSDLGMMAKKDTDGNLYVTVADIRTAKPLANVEVEVNSYVGIPLASGKTDSNGLAIFNNPKSPFTVSAKLNKQTSYLKISEGTNLSTSHFEIGGEKRSGGLKGIIYGERGVWRPGDAMFLTFILQDLEKKLPKDIPVSFELSDPMGRITDTQVLSKSVNYFYPITTKTADDAPTGLWTAKVTIGGNSWTKTLSVESIVPNRLAVSLESQNTILTSNNNTFELSGAWLHGAPTPDYNAEVSVAFSPATTSFDGYSEYTFENFSNSIDYNRHVIWDGNLDSNSKAKFSSYLEAGQNLPGMLNAHFISKIYEPSGAFSTESKTMKYSPYDKYVGIKLPKGDASRNMLLTDTDHTVDVVLLDKDGKAAPNSKLNYSVYKLEWKWWWEKDAYTSATHVSSYYYNKITSGTLNTQNGKGSFKFQVKYPDWGRYLVEVSDGNYGHSAAKIVYIDWPGWAGRAQEGGTGSAAMLPLTADKKVYTPDQTAEISFTSNSQASAYISIEKGGHIIKTIRMDTAKGTNVYKLPVTKDMAPNVYVHLTLLQPHMQTANSLPIRLYGVLPVMVDNPDTKLTPVISSSESFEPNKKASFTVSEKSGKAMTYSLAVVDEGLLGLTNFHAPDIRSHFYKKEASELQSWDIYRYVMNAYSGKLETMLAIGGSEDILDNAKNNENRFAPVVRYFGPYTIAAGEKKTTEFEMPYYIGAVRAIVVAAENGAYGTQEKTVPVKSSLMAQPSLPRTLGTNETVRVPVTIFNGDNFEKTVSVTFASRGILNMSQNDSVKLPANGTKIVSFDIQTKAAGHVLFETTVKDDKNVSKSSVSMDIISRGIPVTYQKSFVIKPGDSSSVSVDTPSEKGNATLTVEFSTMPQINLSNRLSYLVQYPHGCIEQITSGGFPQMYLPDYTKLSPDQINEIKGNVASVIDRYPTYQTSSGAMGYWPGNQQPHSWGTCYALHFMTEAKNHGYSVPDTIYQPALNWLSSTASEWQTSSYDESYSIQAYRLFVLALAGKADIGAMNRLYMKLNIPKDAQLLLAGAYSLAGRKDTAENILKSFTPTASYYRNSDDDFSSSLREQALNLYVSNKTYSNSSVKTEQLAKAVAETLASDKWLNTQETAWSLFALLPYYAEKKSSGGSYIVKNDAAEKSDTFTEQLVSVKLPVSYKYPSQLLSVENTGSSTLYGTATCSGMSSAGNEKQQNIGISMSVDGLNKLKTLKSGDEISLKVHISNTSKNNIKNLVLAVPIATCLEFSNERLANQYYSESTYSYQDIRDNIIYTYFDLDKNSSVDFYFNATAAYTGNVTIPAIYAEAMYDNSIRAVVPGFKVQMIK